MKFLADACVSIRIVEVLRARGHDVAWVGDWSQDPGDDEVLARAHAETRVLLTLDKDFGELAILRGAPHSGIVRAVDLRVSEQADHCLKVLTAHESELRDGAIITIERTRVRIRPADK